MSNKGDEWHSHEITRGEGPNPVLDTAQAYLEAAEIVYKQQKKKSLNWLVFPDWFVVHHLSVIAAELFLKSMRVIVSYRSVRDESGPDFENFKHAYPGHHVQLDKIPEIDRAALKDRLSPQHFELLTSIEKDFAARAEIGRGRYPYETENEQTRFPAGDDGRNLAESWLSLAHGLSNFLSDVGVSGK